MKPNLIYLFTDQQRASTIGCLNQESVHTPNLDALASEGTLFTHATCNTPVCTPSRASLLTGKHALNARCVVNDLRLPEEERGIADFLRGQGYRCGYVGKWHLDGISRHQFTPPGRRRHGFDDYWAAYNCNHNYFDCKWYEDADPTLRRAAGYDADVQTDQAISFVARHRNDPFCLFVSWGPPHTPYRTVPQQFLDMYPEEEIELRANAEGADPAEIAGYYAHCTAIDRNVGRVMEALERLGLAERTLLAYSSDHGDMLWAHGHTKKQQPHMESIGVPLIMRWPGHVPPATSDLLISIADYAPTMLGLLGYGPAEWMNGADLSANLLGTADQEPQSVFIAEYASFDQAKQYQPWRGVRTKSHTYARWLKGGGLLFDNVTDPLQNDNLFYRVDHEAIRARLELALQGWLSRLGDPFCDFDRLIADLGQAEEWRIRQEHFYGFGTRNF